MRIPREIVFGTVFLAGFLLIGCAPYAAAQRRPPASTMSANQAHVAVVGQRIANQTLTALQANGLPIGDSYVFSRADDPDHLLGTPGQYVGKVTFQDARIAQDSHGTQIGVLDGGCIEVFANLKDADATQQYFESINTDGPVFSTEFDYWHGIVLLRLSSQLTPDQAHAYQDALDSLPSFLVLPT